MELGPIGVIQVSNGSPFQPDVCADGRKTLNRIRIGCTDRDRIGLRDGVNADRFNDQKPADSLTALLLVAGCEHPAKWRVKLDPDMQVAVGF
jgi:hypothetical protein